MIKDEAMTSQPGMRPAPRPRWAATAPTVAGPDHVVLPFAAQVGAAQVSAAVAVPAHAGPVCVASRAASLFLAEPGVSSRRAAALAVGSTVGQPVSQQQINQNQYVYKTRASVGGDGASGPHPEREPA